MSKKENPEEYKMVVNGFDLTIGTPLIEIKNNVDELCSYITERLKDYEPSKYEGNADEAKKKRVEINKGLSDVQSARKYIKTLNPYVEIEDKLMAAEKLMKQGADKLSEIVKVKEEEEKSKKRLKCIEIWNSKNFSLVSYDKIYEIYCPKWYNKTCKEYEVSHEMDCIIKKVYEDIKNIELLGDIANSVKSIYLENLDIGKALELAKTLKDNQERAEIESAEREDREHEENWQKQNKAISRETKEYETTENLKNLAASALAEDDEEETTIENCLEEEVKKEYLLNFTVTESELLQIKNFINRIGVVFTCKELEF